MNGELSMTSMLTSIFGHVPFSYPKLNTSLYLYNMFNKDLFYHSNMKYLN